MTAAQISAPIELPIQFLNKSISGEVHFIEIFNQTHRRVSSEYSRIGTRSEAQGSRKTAGILLVCGGFFSRS